MADAAGEDAATVLLRALPAEVADAILGRLGGPEADRLRAAVKAAPDPAADAVDSALAKFFDLQRIADRPAAATGAAYSAVAPAPPEEPPPPTAIDELKALPPERLARALEGEPAAAVALILSCLDPTPIGLVMRRLPAELRAELTVRLSRSQVANPDLTEKLARAVADKSKRMAAAKAEPTIEERVNQLADIIRAIPRADRNPLLQRLEAADAQLAALVRDKLYRIEDLLRVPDRQLQALLTELEVKKLAIALKDVDPAVRGKVTANMSSRAKTVLGEESELLGSIPNSAVATARSEVLALLRRLEDEGRVTIEE